MKVGRNDPCPCGSDKKYKKCCHLQESKAIEKKVLEEAEQQRQVRSKPWEVTDFMEPYSEVLWKDLHSSGTQGGWGRLRNMATEDIVQQLSSLGITINDQEFVQLADGREKAWEIGALWWTELGKGADAKTKNFIHLAACELWRRFLPERPSWEMIDDWIQEGYAAGSAAKSCDIWHKVWDFYRQRVSRSVEDPDEVNKMYLGTQYFSNWAQDYEMELLNASLDDKSYVKQACQFIEEYVERFTQEHPLNRKGFQADLCEIYCLAGRLTEAAQLAESLIEAEPDRVRGYIARSEVAKYEAKAGLAQKTPIDWLQQAKNYPVVDGKDFDLDERMETSGDAD